MIKTRSRIERGGGGGAVWDGPRGGKGRRVSRGATHTHARLWWGHSRWRTRAVSFGSGGGGSRAKTKWNRRARRDRFGTASDRLPSPSSTLGTIIIIDD